MGVGWPRRQGVRRIRDHSRCRLFCVQAKLLLPWLHGFDHNMACQIAYSGLYRVSGAARCCMLPPLLLLALLAAA